MNYMSQSTKQEKEYNPIYEYKIEVDDVCNDLIDNYKMETWQNKLVRNIQKWANESSIITHKQMKFIGTMSLVYPQKGIYEEHNWWKDKVLAS